MTAPLLVLAVLLAAAPARAAGEAEFFGALGAVDAAALAAHDEAVNGPVESTVAIPNRERTQGGTLCLPASSGKAPGVVLILGSGPLDRDLTVSGDMTADGKRAKLFQQISDTLCRDGFAVLRYDKRGVVGYDETHDWPIVDHSQYDALSAGMLVRDAAAAARYLKKRPEVDAGRIVLLGISEGTALAPLAAELEPVHGLVLLSAVARKLDKILYFQLVEHPVQTALDVVDEDRDGRISARESEGHPDWTFAAAWDTDRDGSFERGELTAGITLQADADPRIRTLRASNWYRTHLRLEPNALALRRFGGPILVFQGEKDWQTPLSEVALLQESLEGRDLTVTTFPGLGHAFSPPRNAWTATMGPIAPHVLESIRTRMRARFLNGGRS